MGLFDFLKNKPAATPQAVDSSRGKGGRFAPTASKDSRQWESAKRSPRRGATPGGAPNDARNDLSVFTRLEILKRSRYMLKNTALLRMLRADMVNYAVGDGMMVNACGSESDDWNAKAQQIWDDWCMAPDLTGRFDMTEVQDLVCQALDEDGEIFLIKVRDPRNNFPKVQIARAHRCWDGITEVPEDCVDGVRQDPYGRPTFYRFERDDGTMRDVPANAVIHVYAPEQSDASRYVPPTQHAFNNLQDENELLAMEMNNRKEESRHRKIFKRGVAPVTTEQEEEDEAEFGERLRGGLEDEEATTEEDVQKKLGGDTLFINNDEDLKYVDSKNPSAESMAFLAWLHKESVGGVLPYEFSYDPTKVGGASVRLIVGKAGRAISKRQRIIVKRLLKALFTWRIAVAIDEGDLEANPTWYKCDVIRPPSVSVDAGRDRKADRDDLILGNRTFTEDFAEYGQKFKEQMKQRAVEIKYILDLAKQYDIPPNLLLNTSPSTPVTPPEGNTPPAEDDTNPEESKK